MIYRSVAAIDIRLLLLTRITTKTHKVILEQLRRVYPEFFFPAQLSSLFVCFIIIELEPARAGLQPS